MTEKSTNKQTMYVCVGSSKLNNDNMNNNSNNFYEILHLDNDCFQNNYTKRTKFVFLSTKIPMNSFLVFIKPYFSVVLLRSSHCNVTEMDMCDALECETRTCRRILYLPLSLVLRLLLMLDKANRKRQRNSSKCTENMSACR